MPLNFIITALNIDRMSHFLPKKFGNTFTLNIQMYHYTT